MSQPLPDALFGVDGTELPDPTDRDGWRLSPELPPLLLPAAPDIRVLQETLAAALHEHPVEPADHAPSATPAGQHTVPPPGTAAARQPLPAPPAPQGAGVPTGATAPGHYPSARIIATPVQPERSPSATSGGPAVAAAARIPVRLADLRRRVVPPRPGAQRHSRSNGGAGVVLFIAVIIIALLLYLIITDIAQALTRLIP